MKIPASFQRKRARIEIIPLIDIIFFLLATFMMVSLSMIKNQGISVRLPTAATSTPQERKENVTISITEEGRVYLNEEPMGMETLKSRLKALKASNSQLQVFINGDEKAYLGKAINVLDAVRETGITKVSFQTRREPLEPGKFLN